MFSFMHKYRVGAYMNGLMYERAKSLLAEGRPKEQVLQLTRMAAISSQRGYNFNRPLTKKGKRELTTRPGVKKVNLDKGSR